jgi:hypothetical protein
MGRPFPDYILDLTGRPPQAGPASVGHGHADPRFRGRPWISVKWRCCSTYSRIYRNRRGTAYEGRCPKCGAPVKATVGEGGTANRFFEAG